MTGTGTVTGTGTGTIENNGSMSLCSVYRNTFPGPCPGPSPMQCEWAITAGSYNVVTNSVLVAKGIRHNCCKWDRVFWQDDRWQPVVDLLFTCGVGYSSRAWLLNLNTWGRLHSRGGSYSVLYSDLFVGTTVPWQFKCKMVSWDSDSPGLLLT